jgi:ribonuclease R
MTISIGQRVTVRLAEAVPVTGGITLELLELEDQKIPAGRESPAGRNPRRKSNNAKRKKDKIKRKASRTRR